MDKFTFGDSKESEILREILENLNNPNLVKSVKRRLDKYRKILRSLKENEHAKFLAVLLKRSSKMKQIRETGRKMLKHFSKTS